MGGPKEPRIRRQAASNLGSAFLSCATLGRTLDRSGLPLKFSKRRSLGCTELGESCVGAGKGVSETQVQILRLLPAGCLILARRPSRQAPVSWSVGKSEIMGPKGWYHPVFSVPRVTGKVLALPPLLYDRERNMGPLWL